MHIAFELPAWLLYICGGIVAGLILVFAIFGILMFWSFKDGIWR